MSKKAKTKYTKKRPRPLSRAAFARLVEVSPPAIGTYIKRKVIKPHAQTKKFNPILARDAIRANTVQGLQLKMDLDFEVNDAGECYFPNADQDPNPPIQQESEYPDADDMFTDDEKEKGISLQKAERQDEFDYNKVPKDLAEAQKRVKIIEGDKKLLDLREKEARLHDPEVYLPDLQKLIQVLFKSVRDRYLASIEQTVAYTTHETDKKTVREIQTQIVHGVLENLVTLKITDYVSQELAERLLAAGIDESSGMGG